MKLNCWPGCTAIVVSAANRQNLNKVVHCLRRSRLPGFVRPDGSIEYGVIWETDTIFETRSGKTHPRILDRQLRPIVPPPGTIAESEVSALYQPSPEFAESNCHLADGGREPVHGSEGRTA